MITLEIAGLELKAKLQKICDALDIPGNAEVEFDREYYRFNFSCGHMNFAISINGRGNEVRTYQLPMLQSITEHLKETK